MHTRKMMAEAVAAANSVSPEEDKVKSEPPKNFTSKIRCPFGCNKLLAHRTIAYHRVNGCRLEQEEPFEDESQKKRIFCCGICFADFVTKTALFSHLSEEHDINASIHHLTFENKKIFMRFVHWLEAEGGAHFRHKSGAKRRASGKGIFMACNRSGYVERSLSNPMENKVGNFRTGYTCTGFIHGTERNDGTIAIEFCGDHYGHDARMRLPNVVKQLIAKKQINEESCVDIINYLKKHFAPLVNDSIYAQRVCLVDLDELRTLLVTTTKKWKQAGSIPADCEIWEEELLEKAGIIREGVAKIRREDDKPTAVLAKEQNWPRPHIFTTKMNGGYLELSEMNKTSAETVSRLQSKSPTVTEDGIRSYQVDANSFEKDDEEINVETTPPPSPPLPRREVRNSPIYKRALPIKQLNVSLSRQQVVTTMCDELLGLVDTIQNESNNASGSHLIAFLTRIRQLKLSYVNGITTAKQPMTEQQQQHLHPKERIFEEDIDVVGIDYPDEELEPKVIKFMNENLDEHSQVIFNQAIWR